MPIVKIYGFEKDKPELWNIVMKLTNEFTNMFGRNGVGIVVVFSNCFTCGGGGENYQYLEILYRKNKDLKKIMKFLKEIKIGLDIVSIKLLKKGFIEDKKME